MKVYQCDFCSFCHYLHDIVKKHEDKCMYNPKNGKCRSCKFHNLQNEKCPKLNDYYLYDTIRSGKCKFHEHN